MTSAFFLSASVPDPNRDPKYYCTADIVSIRDATRALATVVLPTAKLVWGGHPAITPLIRLVAISIGITGSDKICLYQSRFFKNIMLKENATFERVIKTPSVKSDRDKSLARMRKTMISSEPFKAGIFIGGMEGVEEEFRMFRECHPAALALPIASTGAAALRVFRQFSADLPMELETDMAYPTLFRRLLKLPSTLL